ncbi:hypothetical protein [Rhizobacter sp. Root16D2]|uniref:hypothetical protein n=1 Tax=Rhizobacter sp. Root16D2 TaxID=1736479 RepID=UPI0006FBF1A6|nr:hypothetical protein [Rhizobacter sp. Root16D2]KRB25035.1 hypothetical protein ASE08_02305 [Rhizobacter sp. Root16D2]
MDAQAAAMARSWTVGVYTCTLTVPTPEPGATRCASIEWSPTRPRRLSDAEITTYRRGRDAALRSLGLTVFLVEI